MQLQAHELRKENTFLKQRLKVREPQLQVPGDIVQQCTRLFSVARECGVRLRTLSSWLTELCVYRVWWQAITTSCSQTTGMPRCGLQLARGVGDPTGRVVLQLQTQILELQTQFDVKDRELGQVQNKYDTLKSQLEEMHTVRAAAVAQLLICSSQDHRVEARDREQGTGLSQIGAVLAKVTRVLICCAVLSS